MSLILKYGCGLEISDADVQTLVVVCCRYTAQCSQLLVKCKVAFKQVESDEYPTVETFMKKLKVRHSLLLKLEEAAYSCTLFA